MLDFWSVRSGSVTGRLHREKETNNQDSHIVAVLEGGILGIIADGCSGSPHSEVGAYLTTRLIFRSLLMHLEASEQQYSSLDQNVFQEALTEARLDTLATLRNLASQLGPTTEAINDAFLSTCLGFLLTPEDTFLFAIGDGCFLINDEQITFEAHEGNAPDMLIYGAVQPNLLTIKPNSEFRVFYRATENINSLVVATDGLEYLMKAAGKPYPGSDDPIPEIDSLWKSDVPILAQLRKANNTSIKPIYDRDLDILAQSVQKGVLLDDTTVVVVKRRKETEVVE